MRALASGVAAFSLLAAPALAQQTRQDMTQTETDDPYLWLEEVEGDRALAQVREWNSRTLGALEADPLYQTFYLEMLEVVNSQDKIPSPGQRGGFIYNFWQDETNVRGLWRRTTRDSYLGPALEWDVLVDFDRLAADEGRNWVYSGVDCAPPEYNRCLVSLSDGGGDAAIRREFDIETRTWPAGGFNVPIAKSGSAWLDPDTLLLTTDWGAAEPDGSLTESGYPYIVKRLARGQALDQAVEVYRGQPADVGVWPGVTVEDGRTWVTITRAVTFYESEYLLQGDDGAWVRLPLPMKSTVSDIIDGWLIVALQEDWTERGFRSGDLIALDLAVAAAGAAPRAELVWRPGERAAFQSAAASAAGLVVAITDNVQGQAWLYRGADANHWTGERIALPDNGVVSLASVDRDESTAFFNANSMLVSNALYFADLESGETRAVKQLPEWFDAATMDVEQLEAVSSDGTRIPYFVMKPKTVQGPAPTLLYGYGGFQVSMDPSYSASRGLLWVQRGGVFVLANIRGGGEFGPAWHQAGLKTDRQIIYDDFIAIAEDLIARGVTTKDQLGIQGGSNGGLLMGVMFTQRPDLFSAVLCEVPLLDMLRYDRLLAGASWVGEYGSPSIPEERAFLESISPYQNVRAGMDYPAIFFVTSTKDDRVHPGHARKMAARLQELGYGFDYYENIDGGHSAAANLIETARRTALEFAWAWRQLGGEDVR